MTRFLLDTNIVSDLMRDPHGPVGTKVREVGGWNTYTSSIVLAELRFGIVRKKSERLARRLEIILTELSVAAFAEPADRAYASLRAGLEAAGTPIGANDLWIAAQALNDESVLVTDNLREFGCVPGLKVENWLRA